MPEKGLYFKEKAENTYTKRNNIDVSDGERRLFALDVVGFDPENH